MGVLHTGDMGRIDDEGFIYITGRIKRIAKISGKRISLDELQDYVGIGLNHECACICVEGVIVAVVSMDTDEEKVVDIIQSYTGVNRRFIRCRIVKAMPVNGNGKIDYEKLMRE